MKVLLHPHFFIFNINVLYVTTWEKNDYSNASSHKECRWYILLIKWFMNWRLAKLSCAQIIVSAFSCLNRGHRHISGISETLHDSPHSRLFSCTLSPHPPREVHCRQWTWLSHHHQGNNFTLHLCHVSHDKHKYGK